MILLVVIYFGISLASLVRVRKHGIELGILATALESAQYLLLVHHPSTTRKVEQPLLTENLSSSFC